MKEELNRKKEIQMIRQKIHRPVRTKRPEPNRDIYVLPENFTEKDLIRAKKLMKGKP